MLIFHLDTLLGLKLEKGPTDKAKEPDPGGSDQQNLGYKKLKNRKTDRTVRLNYCIFQYFLSDDHTPNDMDLFVYPLVSFQRLFFNCILLPFVLVI